MLRLVSILSVIALAACGAPNPAESVAATEAGAPAASEGAPAAASIALTEAFAPAMPGGVSVGAGYVTIVSPGGDRLLGASSPRAASVELHTMSMEGGTMQMRPVDGIDVPPGQAVALAPGGDHLMFFGVTEPFAEGQTVPVTLRFETAGDVELALTVRERALHGAH